MPYYNAGDYYQGDNYAAGGLLGSVGRVLSGVVRGAVGAVIPTFAPRPGPQIVAPNVLPVRRTPGVSGIIQRTLPGGKTGYEIELPGMMRRRRRLNPLNPSALRRAGRRIKGFLRFASRMGALPINRGKGKLIKRKARR